MRRRGERAEGKKGIQTTAQVSSTGSTIYIPASISPIGYDPISLSPLIYRLLNYVAGFSETMNFLIAGKRCVDLAENQLNLHNAFK